MNYTHVLSLRLNINNFGYSSQNLIRIKALRDLSEAKV